MGLFAGLTAVAMAWLTISGPSSPAKSAAPAAPLMDALARSVQNPAPVSPPLSHQDQSAQSAAIDRNVGIGLLHLPPGYQPVDGRCDLLVHFHGVPKTVSSALDQSGIQAALLVINLGTASTSYEWQYADAQALHRTLVTVERNLSQVLPAPCQIGQVALSAWSAGFGAVLKIVAHETSAERVDAVLLADGLHATFGDKRQRIIDGRGIAPFTHFAADAANGDKLMSITHSSVGTDGYASTTETASFLLMKLGLSTRPHSRDDVPNMSMSYRADQRGLHVQGFQGSDAHAHCDHLHEFGKLLLPDLRARWAK